MKDISQVELACKISTYVTEYIKAADTKAGTLFAITGAVTTLVVGKLPNILNVLLACGPCWKILTLFLLVPFTLSILGIFVSTLSALLPRVDSAASLCSFPDIAALDSTEFRQRVTALNPNELGQEYLKHTHTLSKIAKKKYDWLKKSVFCFYIWFGSLFIIFILRGISLFA